MSAARTAEHITVSGVVQGVGFRPFVHRLATELGLDGTVGNDSTQVFIDLAGTTDHIERFVARLMDEAPPLAHIESITRQLVSAHVASGFAIVKSTSGNGERTLVSPDTATCLDCLRELFDPTDRRFHHPFITCTNCGPRFTIIVSLPYDRPNTTMADFKMCSKCASEYRDPGDRRFHAQPIACHRCGPQLWFRASSTSERLTDDPIGMTTAALGQGEIIAIKGLGGYNLACDATSDRAVADLRQRKRRPDKPFAVMVANLDAARELAIVADFEADLLASPAAPIVLLTARSDSPVAGRVTQGNPLIGVMLPNTPVHHLLFARRRLPLVMTSANRSGEPIAHREGSIMGLVDLFDGLLDHDRPIEVPCDDSVVRVVSGRLLPIRRSRGYAPLPITIPTGLPSVLATGAEIKNTFCVTKGSHAWVSPHIGNMENMPTLDAFERMVDRFTTFYDIDPAVVAIDEHPGYLVSRWGRQNHPDRITEVQHHHAHIAAVMAEHHLDPTEPLLGFAFDGTGYGSDGTIWGGEVLVATAFDAKRIGRITPVLLPGGDAGVRHTARTALAYLHACGIPWVETLPAVRAVAPEHRRLLQQQLLRRVACVPSTSMGRFFDAISSLVGLRHEISYEAQAAIELEVAADQSAAIGFGYRFDWRDGEIGIEPVLQAAVRDVVASEAAGLIAWRFHDAVAEIVHRIAVEHRDGGGSSLVALSGGTFQNALLTRLCIERLEAAGLTVLTPTAVPPNDGGLALGQAFVAAHRAMTSYDAGGQLCV